MKLLNKNFVKLHLYWVTLLAACVNEPEIVSAPNTYQYLLPNYDNTEIRTSSDTLQFKYPDSLYHTIKSFNVFVADGRDFLSMFDSKQQVVLIYDLLTQNLVTQLPVNNFFDNITDFYTTAYVINFDSIYIFSNKKVELFDSNKVLKKSVPFLEKTRPQVLYYSSGNPPIFVGDKIYTGIRQANVETSFDKLKRQRIIYEFNMKKKEASLSYTLPNIYYSQYYDFQHLQRSHCFNDRNRFVLSFAADSNIYETDLSSYNTSYFGKSRYQTTSINPVQQKDTRLSEEGDRSYKTNDAYGSIFFDSFRKRYLRIAFQKISESDYLAKRKNRPQTMIIFDQNFRIIGESSIDTTVNCERLFFAPDGEIYALLLNEKYIPVVRFVRLEYYDNLKL